MNGYRCNSRTFLSQACCSARHYRSWRGEFRNIGGYMSLALLFFGGDESPSSQVGSIVAAWAVGLLFSVIAVHSSYASHRSCAVKLAPHFLLMGLSIAVCVRARFSLGNWWCQPWGLCSRSACAAGAALAISPRPAFQACCCCRRSTASGLQFGMALRNADWLRFLPTTFLALYLSCSQISFCRTGLSWLYCWGSRWLRSPPGSAHAFSERRPRSSWRTAGCIGRSYALPGFISFSSPCRS